MSHSYPGVTRELGKPTSVWETDVAPLLSCDEIISELLSLEEDDGAGDLSVRSWYTSCESSASSWHNSHSTGGPLSWGSSCSPANRDCVAMSHERGSGWPILDASGDKRSLKGGRVDSSFVKVNMGLERTRERQLIVCDEVWSIVRVKRRVGERIKRTRPTRIDSGNPSEKPSSIRAGDIFV